MTVTLTGEDDCRVEGETVKAKITKGKRRISVSPASAITNADGHVAVYHCGIEEDWECKGEV